MKTRFDALTSAADRRALAYFRSSGAVGFLLSLLVIGTVHSPGHRQETMPSDLLALELGAAQPVRIDELAIAPPLREVAGRTDPTHHTSTPDDEFAIGPYDSVEPVGY